MCNTAKFKLRFKQKNKWKLRRHSWLQKSLKQFYHDAIKYKKEKVLGIIIKYSEGCPTFRLRYIIWANFFLARWFCIEFDSDKMIFRCIYQIWNASQFFLLCYWIKLFISFLLRRALLWVPSLDLANFVAFFSFEAIPVLIISSILFSRGESPATSLMIYLTDTTLFVALPFLVTGLVFHNCFFGRVTMCPWFNPTYTPLFLLVSLMFVYSKSLKDKNYRS